MLAGYYRGENILQQIIGKGNIRNKLHKFKTAIISSQKQIDQSIKKIKNKADQGMQLQLVPHKEKSDRFQVIVK